MAVHYGGKIARDVWLTGTEETYFDIKNYEITAGRAFTAQEVRTGLPVLVIGQRGRREAAGTGSIRSTRWW